jgi:hypothetical protein
MRHASIIKLFFLRLSLGLVLGFGLGFGLALPAFAQPKREPLPQSIEDAKAGPYVKTSLDPKPAAEATNPRPSPATAATLPKDAPKNAPKNAPKDTQKDTSKDTSKAPVSQTSTPVPTASVPSAPAALPVMEKAGSKGKYIKIPAPNVDLTPVPPPATPAAPGATTGTPAPDPARKAEADSVINDLEDLAAAPPPPPKRDPQTGDVVLPNKSRTVVVERGSMVLDSSALKTIMEAQNRDDLVSYGNTMGKTLAENLTLLSPFYGFSLSVTSPETTPAPAAEKPSLEKKEQTQRKKKGVGGKR